MIAISYTLKLLEPLLATALQSDPNSAVSYPFIPGSLIRGALISDYLAQTKSGQDFALKKESRQLFLNGDTRYLNGYVLNNNGQRALPTPLNWYKDKSARLEDDYKIYDKAHPDFEEADFLTAIEQPKPLEPQFCALDEDEVTLYEVERQVNIHTRREDRSKGRADEDERGAVFRYDALAAGQFFGGIILCRRAADAEALLKQLKDKAELLIGASRSGGYGRARVIAVKKIHNWREIGTAPAAISANTPLTITLLSDMILRDDRGQFTDTLSPEILADALGAPPEALKPGKVYRQSAIVGGFNRKWGLPLPQSLAIRAGSVFNFQAESDIPAEAIENLLRQGLGERRAEGFGRVAVNWVGSEVLQAEKGKEKVARPNNFALDAESKKLALQMTERLFRRNADRALAKRMNALKIINAPRRSQLGGLRVEIRKAIPNADLESVIEYLQTMKATAGKQFEAARVKNTRLKDWLLEQLQAPNQIWQNQLGSPNTTPLLKDLSFTPSAELAAEYTLRFIDAVLAKASKEAKND